jgi:hypothetical protein
LIEFVQELARQHNELERRVEELERAKAAPAPVPDGGEKENA